MSARINIAVFMVAFASLLTELLLMRVLDVVLSAQLEYIIITCAMFSLGVAGVYMALWPVKPGNEMRFTGIVAIIAAFLMVIVRPLFNLLPFSYSETVTGTPPEYLMLAAMYLAVFSIFFCVGLIFVQIFSFYSRNISQLYGWDLVGAACGCIAIIFLLPLVGPGGLLFWSAAMMLCAAAILLGQKKFYPILAGLALICAMVPGWKYPDYYDFGMHIDKRKVLQSEKSAKIELTRWDPISKVDVIPVFYNDHDGKRKFNKHVALDGGTCSSYFYPFDGDFHAFRERIQKGGVQLRDNFSTWGVPLSHYLKRDQNQNVLVIGSAGGQEIKAALTYGAAHVDAIDLVGTTIELAKTDYASFIGNIYNDSRVNGIVGEGRSYLQASDKKYDIIQIYSHSTSSRAAWGYGPLRPEYLVTSEAFEQYFEHLSDDGILQINFLDYPRLVSVAASGWGRVKRTGFMKHVVVFGGANNRDFLSTVLIKMTPWTQPELDDLKKFLQVVGDNMPLLENPLDPTASKIGKQFFSQKRQKEMMRGWPYRVSATVDDRPYFNFHQNYFNYLPKYEDTVFNYTTWQLMLEELVKGYVSYDIQPIFVAAVITLACVFLFIFIPLGISRVGSPLKKISMLTYFACLGFGFVLLELCFIQIFMKLIGFPLYACSTVIFTMLFFAGLGSNFSEKIGITPLRRWAWPFIGILVTGYGVVHLLPSFSEHFLAQPVAIRIVVGMLLLAPLGFCLGMPFPLGLTAINHMGRSGLAWAWALNSSFTAVGGVAMTVLSLVIGFKATIYTALCVYALAFLIFPRLRAKAL